MMLNMAVADLSTALVQIMKCSFMICPSLSSLPSTRQHAFRSLSLCFQWWELSIFPPVGGCPFPTLACLKTASGAVAGPWRRRALGGHCHTEASGLPQVRRGLVSTAPLRSPLASAPRAACALDQAVLEVLKLCRDVRMGGVNMSS